METGTWTGVAAAVVLLGLLCLLVLTLVSGHRIRKALLAAQQDLNALRARLDAMSEELASARARSDAPSPPDGYVITTAGTCAPADQTTSASVSPTDQTASASVSPGERGSARVLLSGTIGEPLLKAMAFGHGLRRALAPQTRNRIAFEMRQEVKRARKQRKRDLRQRGRDANTAERRTAA